MASSVSGIFSGECCLSGNEHRLVTATTVTECSLVRLEKDALIHALGHDPTFAKMFLARMLAAKVRVEETLATHMFDNSEVRLAKTLLNLAKFGEHDRPETVIEKLNQETLAQMIGTTRSRVNYFMNKFRRLGYVDYNGDIRVRRSLLDAVMREPQKTMTPNRRISAMSQCAFTPAGSSAVLHMRAAPRADMQSD